MESSCESICKAMGVTMQRRALALSMLAGIVSQSLQHNRNVEFHESFARVMQSGAEKTFERAKDHVPSCESRVAHSSRLLSCLPTALKVCLAQVGSRHLQQYLRRYCDSSDLVH